MSRIYYVGLRLSRDSDLALAHHLGHNRASTRLHCTLAYSREWFPYKWQPPKRYVVTSDYRLGIFGVAQVLLFNHSEISARHQQLCDTGASYDFPEYRPHVTIGDASETGLTVPGFPLVFDEEYYQTWDEE